MRYILISRDKENNKQIYFDEDKKRFIETAIVGVPENLLPISAITGIVMSFSGVIRFSKEFLYLISSTLRIIDSKYASDWKVSESWRLADNDLIQLGDPAYIDYTNDGKVDHAIIITSIDVDEAIIGYSANSKRRTDHPFDYIFKKKEY